MVLFWIVIAAVILLATTTPIYMDAQASSLCGGNPMYRAIISDEETQVEYAIVTATITGKQVVDDHPDTYEHVMEYDINEIRYMPSARSEIHVMNGTFMTGHRGFSSADVGAQFVVSFYKHESWGTGWVMSSPYCSGLYHTDLLEYIEWFEELRDGQPLDGDVLYPQALGNFVLPPDNLPDFQLPEKIGYRDEISIARLSNATSIEEELDSGYLVLQNMYVFDTVYNFYNADTQTKMVFSAWGNRVPTNLEEDHLYFLYRSVPYYNGNGRIIAVEPLESSYDLITSTLSPKNVRQIAFYNDARYIHSVLYDEIRQNPALDGKIHARYNEQYDAVRQDTHEYDRYEYEMYVTIYSMDQGVLDGWKALLKKYGLEDAKIGYSIDLPVSIFPEPPYETWRDYHIPTVQDQLDWRTPPFEILCDDTLYLVILPDGMPACVTASEASEMLVDGSAVMQVRPTIILNVDS